MEEHIEKKKLLSLFLVLLLTAGLNAQKSDSLSKFVGRMGSNLAQQARNPTASLTMMQIVVNHVPSFYNLEGADQTSIVIMPIIPFKTGKLQHIARIILPYVAAGQDWGILAQSAEGIIPPPNFVPTADKTGLSDLSLFDVLIFPAPWNGGRLAAGVSAILPLASDPALGTEK